MAVAAEEIYEIIILSPAFSQTKFHQIEDGDYIPVKVDMLRTEGYNKTAFYKHFSTCVTQKLEEEKCYTHCCVECAYRDTYGQISCMIFGLSL